MVVLINKAISTATDCASNEKQAKDLTEQNNPRPNADICVEANCASCNNKGVHYYLTNNNSKKAKCIRAFIVLVASVCAAYVCVLSSRRYFYTWVQTVIERTDVHVSEIPFPAVTICPVKGLDFLHLEKESAKFLKPTQRPKTDKELQDLHMLLNTMNELMWPNMDTMDAPHPTNQTVNVEQFLEILTSNKSMASAEAEMVPETFDTITLSDLMSIFSYECEDVFAECTWRRAKVSCCTLFRKLHTHKGVCYAFNSLLVENPNPSWPFVVSESGLHTGLRVLIKHSSRGNNYNKVAAMVHDNREVASSEIVYLKNERVFITINPLRFTADYDIRSIKPELRHCYFRGELELLGKSLSNCITGCRLKYIERSCNCTYIRPGSTDTTETSLPICIASHLKCLYDNRDTLLSTGNIIEEIIDDVHLKTWDCRCYPNCNYIQYRTSVYTDGTGNAQRNTEYIDLQVHYQHDTLFSYRSSLCFTLLDLIVSYGGIAGLFLGLSLVGIIEVVHDVIMCCKLRTRKNVAARKAKTTAQARQEDTKPPPHSECRPAVVALSM